MTIDLDLQTYLEIEPHAPSRYLTHEEAIDDTTNGIDDLAASMVAAHNVHIHKPANTGIGCTSYNPGQNVSFQYHIYAAGTPANRRNYKHRTVTPVVLAQREWPYV